MMNLKSIVEKYDGTVDAQSATSTTMEVHDVIIAQMEEESANLQLESALATTTNIVAALDEMSKVELAFAVKPESVTVESATSMVKQVLTLADKLGYESEEDKEYMGIAVGEVTVESAMSYPEKTSDITRESAAEFIKKAKETAIKILEQIIAALKSLGKSIAAMFGNNQAVAEKLHESLKKYDDKEVEGAKLDIKAMSEKLPRVVKFDKASILAELEVATSVKNAEKFVKNLIDGIKAKDLTKFRALDGIGVDASVKDTFKEVEGVDSGFLVAVTGGSLVAVVKQKDGEDFKVTVETVENKPAGKEAPFLSIKDMEDILGKVITTSKDQSKLASNINVDFDTIKKETTAVDDEEFLKANNLSVLTGVANRVTTEKLKDASRAIKSAIEICALNIKVKAKKEESKDDKSTKTEEDK